MRARDARAIAFCIATTVALAVGLHLIAGSFLVTLAGTAAYAILLLTRPRMQRVLRRVRGDPDWGGYFKN